MIIDNFLSVTVKYMTMKSERGVEWDEDEEDEDEEMRPTKPIYNSVPRPSLFPLLLLTDSCGWCSALLPLLYTSPSLPLSSSSRKLFSQPIISTPRGVGRKRMKYVHLLRIPYQPTTITSSAPSSTSSPRLFAVRRSKSNTIRMS